MELGTHYPMYLINAIWWLFTLHFGLRGRQQQLIVRFPVQYEHIFLVKKFSAFIFLAERLGK